MVEEDVGFSFAMSLRGEAFYPSELDVVVDANLETLLSLDPGSTSKSGRVLSTGVLHIKGDSIDSLYRFAKRVLESAVGVTAVEFDVARFFDGQCNLEISATEIAQISELGGDLSISCYDNED
ncbi:hypothetical protein [Thalassobius sp. MITS945101]|uniref:hypothetical protein n=1 Tax=Thalassobius sp. MITS945101 TaxID=3096994 RepID=UPI00399AA969